MEENTRKSQGLFDQREKNYSNPKAARVQRSWSQSGWVRRLSQGLGRLDCHAVDTLRHAHFHHEKLGLSGKDRD